MSNDCPYLNMRYKVTKPEKPLKNWPKIKKAAGRRAASTRMAKLFARGLK